MEIVTSIHICLISQMNFDSKGNSWKKSFSLETKALISCILMQTMCLRRPIRKRMEIVTSINVYLISWMNFDLRKMVRRKLFLESQSINIMYPNGDNMFMDANHKMNGNYYEYQCLLIRWMNFDSMKNYGMKIFSWKTKALLSCTPMRTTCLWGPATKKMEIIMSIHVISFDRWTLILWKMVEGKAFLGKPRHQYHVS